MVTLLGFDIDNFDFETAISFTTNLIKTRRGGQVITINPEMIEFALKNKNFAKILHEASLVIPDGVGIELGLKLKGIKAKRIAGIEYSYRLLQECAKNNYSVALVGAKPEIIEKACERLKTQISNLNIVYSQDGYYKDQGKVQWCMGEKNPQLVLVALGSPKQEEFIAEYRKYHSDTVMIGVGGSFDVWAGVVERAPKIYQDLGLEWLYRAIKEPKRFKRIFPTLPKFLLRVLFNN